MPALILTGCCAYALWNAPALVFIDGAIPFCCWLADWQNWGARVMAGGLLAIHDVFPNPLMASAPFNFTSWLIMAPC